MNNVTKVWVSNEIRALKVAISKLKDLENACVQLADSQVTKTTLIELISNEVLKIQQDIEIFTKSINEEK